MTNVGLEQYVPIAVRDARHQTWHVDGTVVFADVSGFTKLSEKLAEQGKAGAEELTDILLGTFTDLLGEAREEGGDLLKFGGDALLILFVGPGHAVRATRPAFRIRDALKARGPIETGRGRVVLRVSQGVHTGRFHLVLAGEGQLELLVIGPDATFITELETAASAGQIVVSATTADGLPPNSTGVAIGPGLLLRRMPPPTSELLTAPAPAAVDLSLLVPPAIRRRIEAGDLDPEHRHVAIGFVHIAGVDAYLASHGPEATAQALDAIAKTVDRAARDAGVCLLASDLAPDGAKLILTAGAPDAIEDIEGRLLVALRNALDGDLPLPVRAGAHSGHVFASDVGAPWRRVYTVIGDAVNLAARLMGKAEPGQIIASRTLLDRSTTPFELEPLEPFMVKGKRHPQIVAVVGARIEGRQRSQTLTTPFVGRSNELKIIGSAFEELRSGRGGCVEIVGPPGIGKSRLVDEVLDRADEVTKIRITCEPFQADLPYFVARLALRRMLGIAIDADRREAGQALTSIVAKRAPALAWSIPLLAATIDADVDSTPEVDQLEPANRSDALAEAVALLLAAVVTEQQVVVFEDAMWMDEASAKVVARVLRDAHRRPSLTVMTRRLSDLEVVDEEPRGLHAGLGFETTRVDLEPLTRSVAIDLVEEMTDESGLSSRDIELLCDRAAGNPLYLVELLRAVVEAGSLDDVPVGLEDILAARIDALPREERRLLRVASVLGDRFDTPLLAEVATGNTEYGLENADVAAATDRLSEFISHDHADLVFQHGLVRQVAYEGLPFTVRRGMHRRAATILEARPGRPDDNRLAMLGYHWDCAGDRERAWAALRRSADRAIDKSAFHEASVLFERAIDNGRRAEVPGEELGAVAEQLGDAAELAARFDVASEGFRQARRLTAIGDLRYVDLLRKEGLVREKAGRYDAALKWLRRGLNALSGRDDLAAVARRAELEVAYAGVRFRQGKLRNCVRWCERAIADAERVADRKTLANALYVIEGALTDLHDPRAGAYSGRSLEIYRELGDNVGLGRALLNMGVNADRAGQLDEAAAFYEQSREAIVAASWFIGLAHVSLNLGGIHADQGKLDEAERLLKDARRAATASQYSMIMWASVSGLGRVATRARQFDRAQELLAESAGQFDRMGASTWAAEAKVFQAEAHLFEGNPLQALATLDDAAGFGVEALEGAGVEPLSLRVRGCALGLIGRHDDGFDMLRRSIDCAEADGSEYEVALSLAELATAAGVEKGEAAAALARANEIADRLGVNLRVVCSQPTNLVG